MTWQEYLADVEARLSECGARGHAVMAVEDIPALIARVRELEEFVLWLTPCGQGDYEHPTYKLIGETARAVLAKEVPK